MKLAELLDITRRELDDVAEPYLWSDDEMIEYANDAQNEACRRGRLLVDASNVTICQVAIVAGTATYALDPRVIRVNRAKVRGESMTLGFCMTRNLDRLYPGWEDWSETPRLLVPDWETGKIRLVGNPDADGTLDLTVVRLPLAQMDDLDESPEIREEYQRNLRHWMKYRAYSKRDSQTFDPKKSAESLALFEAEFGPARPAYDEMWQQAHTVEDEYTYGRY